MIQVDEDSLICDLAETYKIYDYRKFSPTLISKFAVGLSQDSRIKRKLRGEDYTTQEIMLAGIFDRLSLLVYSRTKDAQKGRNYPKSLVERMTQKDTDIVGFRSGEEFEKVRSRLLKGVKNGN